MAQWLSGWSYRKSHEIVGSTAGAVTDYQIRIKVHYGSGTDSGEDVYLNGKCRSDFGDIRFTDSDGVTELSYWMEEKVDGDYAIFWVKVPSIPASPDTATIYIYYGNPSATTASDGEATFVLFDHFDTLDTTKWDTLTLNGGTVGVTGSKLKMTSGSTEHNGAGVISKSALPDADYAIEAYIMRETGRKTGELGLLVGLTSKAYRDTTYYGNYSCSSDIHACGKGTVYEYTSKGWRLRAWYYDQVVHGSTALETWDGKWVRLTVKVKNSARITSARFIYGSTDVTLTTSAGSAQITPLYVQIYYGEYGKSGYSSYCDWIAVRKYVEPEPSHGAWGSQESQIFLTESLGLADSVVKAPSAVKAEVLGLVDTYSRTWTIQRTYSEVLGLADAVTATRLLVKSLTELLGLSDVMIKSPSVVKSESLGLLDVYSRTWIAHKTYSELLGLADSLQKKLGKAFPPRISRKTFEDLRIEMRKRLAKVVAETLTSEESYDRLQEYQSNASSGFRDLRAIHATYLVEKSLFSFE
ncbi:MAG: hypothetical protein DRJ18_01400 [Candidatus Methanomethylicota archaeon]|nr:MAG: hypothetical protein DRJ18_01400 [Candidatus Verstraetearchaeota archaeon]